MLEREPVGVSHALLTRAQREGEPVLQGREWAVHLVREPAGRDDRAVEVDSDRDAVTRRQCGGRGRKIEEEEAPRTVALDAVRAVGEDELQLRPLVGTAVERV